MQELTHLREIDRQRVDTIRPDGALLSRNPAAFQFSVTQAPCELGRCGRSKARTRKGRSSRAGCPLHWGAEQAQLTSERKRENERTRISIS